MATKSKQPKNSSDSIQRVVLNPLYGGFLPGAYTPRNPGVTLAAVHGNDVLLEKIVNLNIAHSVSGYLRHCKVSTMLTREGDFHVTDLHRAQLAIAFDPDVIITIGQAIGDQVVVEYQGGLAAAQLAKRIKGEFNDFENFGANGADAFELPGVQPFGDKALVKVLLPSFKTPVVREAVLRGEHVSAWGKVIAKGLLGEQWKEQA